MKLIEELIESSLTFKQKILVAEILESPEIIINDDYIDSVDLAESIFFVILNFGFQVSVSEDKIIIFRGEIENSSAAPSSSNKKLILSLGGNGNKVDFEMKNKCSERRNSSRDLDRIFIILSKYYILYNLSNNIFNIYKDYARNIYNNICKTNEEKNSSGQQLAEAKLLNLLNLGGLAFQLTFNFDKTSANFSANSAIYNKIKYLDKLFKLVSSISKKLAEKLAENSPISGELTMMKFEVDDRQSIQKIRKKSKINKNRKIESQLIIDHFRNKISLQRASIGAVAYFPKSFAKDSHIAAGLMLKILTKEIIIEAIDWFFADDYWSNKIDSMSMVERHINKFMAIRKKETISAGRLTKKLKKTSI